MENSLSDAAAENAKCALGNATAVGVPDPPFIVQHTDNNLGPIWDMIYLAISCLWLIFGIPGNLMVILSVACFKELKSVPMFQVANLAISDLSVSVVNVVTSWAILLYDSGILLKHNFICQITGYVCNVGCRCSIACICSIAINRYVSICREPLYAKIYNKYTMWMHILVPWMVGPLVMMAAVVKGKSAFVFDRRQLICPPWYFTDQGYQSVQWLELIFLLPPSFGIMTFTSYKIFSKVHQSGRNFNPNATFSDRDIHLMKVLILMFVAFFAANFPYFLLCSLDFSDKAPHGMYYLAIWLIHSATAINPIIYAAKYPQFQKTFKKLIMNAFCCAKIPFVLSNNNTRIHQNQITTSKSALHMNSCV